MMRFSLKWLKTFLETSATPQEISDQLTCLGLEVDALVDEAKVYGPYKVVRIKDVCLHPNADKLKVCHVDDGSGTPVQIVCGALNVRQNMLSVLAPVGVTLPQSSIKIKEACIRGVESFGMLCSAQELGLNGNSSGIMDLDTGVPGQSLSELEGFGNCVFEVSVTPNRADCMGVYGIARDLAAAKIGTLKALPQGDLAIKSAPDLSSSEIIMALGENQEACPEYRVCGMRGVRNGESPQWLKECLQSSGMEPISALVDITNYIALSFARPLHIYDWDKLETPLTVRWAHENEKFSALNGKEYVLSPDMLVIADEKAVCALAGIMGGMQTRCTPETTSIWIESALFDSVEISKIGQKLNLLSEARARFERGVDSQSCLFGLSLAVYLIKEICGGTVVFSGGHEVFPPRQSLVRWDEALFVQLTGITLSPEEGPSILERLGFVQREENLWEVPSWRVDISLPEDLVEEVLRIKGLESIEPKELGSLEEGCVYPNASSEQETFLIKRLLAQSGLTEILTYAFIGPKEAELFGAISAHNTLQNPLSLELSVLRPSLIPGLLKVLRMNNNHGTSDIGVFECGSVFFDAQEQGEQQKLSGVLKGKVRPVSWRGDARVYDFLDAKEKIYTIIRASSIEEGAIRVDRSLLPLWLHPHESGRLYIGGDKSQKTLGFFGTLHPKILQEMDLPRAEPIVCFELNMGILSGLKKKRALSPLRFSVFPKVTRDFSFIMASHTEMGPVLESIKKVDISLIEKVEVFDIYEGKSLGAFQKAVAFRVWISSDEKTLTEREITFLCSQIESVCVQQGLVLRSLG